MEVLGSVGAWRNKIMVCSKSTNLSHSLDTGVLYLLILGFAALRAFLSETLAGRECKSTIAGLSMGPDGNLPPVKH